MQAQKRLVLTILLVAASLSHAGEWIYSERTDKMTDEKIVSAMLPSSNKVDIGPPYGSVLGSLFVSKIGGEVSTVAFGLQRGIIDCSSVGKCYVSVRFDSAEPEMLAVDPSGGGRYTTVFFQDSVAFITKLNAAKRILVRASVYGSGAPVFEFDQASTLK